MFGSVTISDFQKRIFIDFRYRASYTCNLATTTGYYKSIKRSLITDKTARVLSRFIISIVYSYSYCHKNRSLFLHHKKRYTNDLASRVQHLQVPKIVRALYYTIEASISRFGDKKYKNIVDEPEP